VISWFSTFDFECMLYRYITGLHAADLIHEASNAINQVGATRRMHLTHSARKRLVSSILDSSL
jgi:hypothetical protein